MTGRIFATIAPTWLQDAGALTGTFEYALAFSVSVDQFLTEVAWRRSATGAQNLPTHLRVWDTTTAGTIYEVPIIPDDGAVGWQVHVPGVIVPLVADRQYRVAATWPVGNRETYAVTGSGSPSSPIVLPGTYRYYNTGVGYPNTTPFGTTWVGIDVGVDDAPPSGTTPPDVPTSVDAALAGWLITTGDNTHQEDGLPWRTDANVTIVKDEAEGVSGFAAIKAVADAVAAGVSGLPGTIAGAVTTITGQLTAMSGTIADTAVVTTGRVIHDLAAVAINTQNSLVELARMSSGTGTFPADVETLIWTLIDEVDFDWQKSWDVPADLYVLTVGTIPPWVDLVDVDGAMWRPRLGWWAPRNGDFFGGRRFVDWEQCHLEDDGRRMPGIVVRTQFGCTCHIQAWRLT